MRSKGGVFVSPSLWQCNMSETVERVKNLPNWSKNVLHPCKLVLTCVQKFSRSRCADLKPFWVHHMLDSKLKVIRHEPNVYVCGLKWYKDKTRPNSWKTHHAININTKVNFVLEHKISSTSKTQSDVLWMPICWYLGCFVALQITDNPTVSLTPVPPLTNMV